MGDNETLAYALNNAGAALLDVRDERGSAYLERSLHMALARGWEEHASRAYTNLACCALNNHNYALAEPFFHKGLAYCSEHDLDSFDIYLRSWLARSLFEQGHWDEAAEEATRVLNHYRLSPAAKIPALTILG